MIEIARHIRDETAQKLDARFDEAYAAHYPRAADQLAGIAVAESGACCTPTPSRQILLLSTTLTKELT